MKVILSMTSTAARNGTRGDTLDSLLAQTRKADEIRLYADPVLMLDETLARYLGPATGFHLIPCRDRGPVTKLGAITDSRIGQDDLIVTVDDDIIYEPRWLETLVAGAEKHPDYAVGFCGWNAADFLRAWKDNDPKGGTYVWPPVPGPCDVLEGWAGVAYRKRFFHFVSHPVGDGGFYPVLSPLPMFRNVDDVWISWQLHRWNVPRAIIGHKMSRERDGALPGLHNQPDFEDSNRKAAIVAFGGVEG